MIERTPSILVLDSQQVSQVTLVGCSFQDIESLFDIRERIANDLPKGIKIVAILLFRNVSIARNQ